MLVMCKITVVCSICEENFASGFNLKRHTLLKHTNRAMDGNSHVKRKHFVNDGNMMKDWWELKSLLPFSVPTTIGVFGGVRL